MTPLDDAIELFGEETLTDRKALRRAYARLVKLHPPDGDAEAFQRVRDAFEAAKEALENPDAAAPDASDVLDALVDGLTPEQLDADLRRIEALAHHARGAALTALFLVQATRPAEVLEWITELRQRGLPDDAMLTLLTAVLELRPTLGTAPLCGALALTLTGAHAATLNGHRARAGVRQDDPQPGFELWRSHELTLRTFDPPTWVHVADAILFFAAERTPDDILDGIERAIEDVGLDVDEQAHRDLVIGLRQARTLMTLVEDPDIPDALPDALRRGQRTSAPGMFSALRQAGEDLTTYGDGSLSDGVQRFALVHPAAYEMLRDLEARLTGGRQFHQQWADAGEPPYVPDETVADLLSQTVETLSRTREALWKILFYGRYPALLLWAILSAPGLLVFIAVMLATHLTFLGFKPVFLRPLSDDEDWLDTCADLQRTYGLWRHEVIVGLQLADREVPDTVLDALFDDQEADLRCLSAAHGFRSTINWRPDPSDEEADEDEADEAHPQTDPEEQADER